MQAKWDLSAGMAVELLPSAVLASLSLQGSLEGLQDSSRSSCWPASSLHVLKDAAARAAGLLLLSEVLAAEAAGVPLAEDLPQLFTDAVAHTVLPAAGGGAGSGGSSSSSMAPGLNMWQHAAVLACSCSRLVRELQMSNNLAEAFDVAARQVAPVDFACADLKPKHSMLVFLQKPCCAWTIRLPWLQWMQG
jgi:hypothetical protein